MAWEHVFSRMVHEDLLGRAGAQFDDRRRRIAALQSAGDAMRYRDRVFRLFRKSFAPFPARTPLHPRITRTLAGDGFYVDMVRYETRPGLWVTANLYRPEREVAARSCPALLVSCGHDPCGKSTPDYQLFAAAMARAGWVVLIFDPIGQGERRQYAAPGKGHDAVEEHIILGNQQTLVGEYLGSWRAWDGIRSLDYLLSCPQVDRNRVAMTGCSGGGTMAAFIGMLEPRLAMIAPSCFGSTWESYLLNESPADSEQNPPGAIGRGLELADAFIARAPRPTLLMAQEHDFFDLRGVREIYNQVKRVYTLLGRPNNVRLHVGPGRHGMHADHRAAMYASLNAWARHRTPIEERPADVRPDCDLRVTESGQVADETRTQLGFDIVADKARRLARQRGRLSESQLPQAIATVLKLPRRRGAPPTWRSLKVWRGKDTSPWTRAWRYAVQTDDNAFSLLHYYSNRDIAADPHNYVAPPGSTKIVVHVPHLSSRQEMLSGQAPVTAKEMYVVDVRGFGESRNLTCYGDDDFFLFYDADFFAASIELMLGGSMLGRRVSDLLRTLDLLESKGCGGVHLTGRGLGSIIAALAACLHPCVTRVTLQHAPRSFHDMTQTPVQQWPLSMLPSGGLAHFDLPDCYHLMRRHKSLRILEPWDATMQPVQARITRP